MIQSACVFALLLTWSPAVAQPTTGSISGVVLDETSARMPGVTILVRQLDTGFARTQTTDERGRYRVLDLGPAAHTVTAEMQGFAQVVRGGVVVAIGRDLQVDIVMRVGSVAGSATVAGEVTAIGLGTATVGGVVTARQIAELPLNGRSFVQLATLQPGVVISRGSGRGFTGGFGAMQLSVAGARPENTGYLMDGTNIADISDKAPSSLAGVLLGVDTVQEFSVQTHGCSAEFGRAAGGVLSAVTKSGTNTLRGSAFEFHRNSAIPFTTYVGFDRAGDLRVRSKSG